MVSSIIIDFLKANGWSNFFQSLLNQYEAKGSLSEKQIQAVQKAIDEKAAKAAKALLPPVYTIKPGEVIEIKAWLAHRLQAEKQMQYFFRNLEVVEVLGETPKAYKVNVKFVSRIVTNCHICGRDLDTEVSRATGIGPVCAKKIGLPLPTLATAQDTLKALEAMVAGIGTIGPIWVAKSQIKAVTATAAVVASFVSELSGI